MKVCAFLVSYGRPVGADLMSRALLESLVARGHEVDVWVDMEPLPGAAVDGVTVRPRSEFRLGERPGDVVYTHADHGSVGFLAARGHRIPLVYIAHNTSATTESLLRAYPPDLMVWNAEATREALGFPGGIVVRSPLRVKDFALPAAVRRAASAVTLVNLTRDKGADVFYGLADRVDADFLGVRGGYGVQDERPYLAEIVGPVADIRDVLARTRVLLMPSVFESWGRIGVEALAAGIPVLASDLPGLRESLGAAGTYLDPTDLDAWEAALRPLLGPGAAYTAARKRASTRAKELEALTGADLTRFGESLEALV